MDTRRIPGNLVKRTTGGYYALWRGELVMSGRHGFMRLFLSEAEAQAFLARCEALGYNPSSGTLPPVTH